MACNEDNALRSLLRFSSLASIFCPFYLSGPTTPPLPDFVTAYPESQIFSACACFESRMANPAGPPPSTETATASDNQNEIAKTPTLTRTLTRTVEHVGGTSFSTRKCSFLHCNAVPPPQIPSSIVSESKSFSNELRPPQTPPSVVTESKSFSDEFRPPQSCSGGRRMKNVGPRTRRGVTL
ncbi:MAG: hypothetical protein Q9167_001130 [Letrouitia subvulpina]